MICERLEIVKRVTLIWLLDRKGRNFACLVCFENAPFGCFLRRACELFAQFHGEESVSEDVGLD